MTTAKGQRWMTSAFSEDEKDQHDDDEDREFLMLDVEKAIASAGKAGGSSKGSSRPRVPATVTRRAVVSEGNRQGHGQVWSAKHAPSTVAALAVHPKKVEEVKFWLKQSLAKGQGGVLFLRGPPGAGKTATVRVLARELQLDLREWALPTETVAFASTNDQENRFIPGDGVTYVSQARLFEEFLRRATTYSSILGGYGGGVVLIEDIPPFARRNRDEFRRIVANFGRGRHPLILVASDAGKERGGPTGEDTALALNADTITFNPANTTNLIRALRSIAEAESASTGFAVPDRDTLAALSETSKGDIRAAINALQFACSKGTKDMKSCFEGATANVGKRKATTKGASKRWKKTHSTDSAASSNGSSAIGGRDGALDLFHSLGKVLYNKRQADELESFTLDERLSSLRRRPLISNPETVLDLSPLAPESFACFLQQSYLPFFSKVNDAAAAADWLSKSECLFSDWTTTGKVSLSEYGGLLAMRGLCFANSSVVKQSGMVKFHRPDLYEKKRTCRERTERLAALLPAACIQSKVECATLLAPALIKCHGSDLSQELADIVRFTASPRQASSRPIKSQDMPRLDRVGLGEEEKEEVRDKGLDTLEAPGEPFDDADFDIEDDEEDW